MIAFKEWEVICRALAVGRQSVILRKGGIHEGREGFSFAHEEFLLFPTRFHAQGDRVIVDAEAPAPEWEAGEEVRLEYFVKVVHALTLRSWAEVAALAEQHVWTEETIRERFDWEGKGMSTGSIHCASVKVARLAEPVVFEYEKKHGGCRSWVEVPDPADAWRDRLAWV